MLALSSGLGWGCWSFQSNRSHLNNSYFFKIPLLVQQRLGDGQVGVRRQITRNPGRRRMLWWQIPGEIWQEASKWHSIQRQFWVRALLGGHQARRSRREVYSAYNARGPSEAKCQPRPCADSACRQPIGKNRCTSLSGHQPPDVPSGGLSSS